MIALRLFLLAAVYAFVLAALASCAMEPRPWDSRWRAMAQEHVHSFAMRGPW